MYVPFTGKQPAFRYERKFPVKQGLLSKSQMEWAIKTNSFFFSEIYHKRQINSIYLDTSSFELYTDNVVGQANRYKFRIRWYGEDVLNASNPSLEIKVKHGLTGDKWIFPLPSFKVMDLNQEKIIHLAKSNNVADLIVEQLHTLNPVLLNTYEREYYLSADKKFRVTLDENLHFYRFSYAFDSLTNVRKTDVDFVLELKYNPEDDLIANGISKQFPFRLDKYSKYITGCDCFYDL